MLARITGILERIDEATAVVVVPGGKPGFDLAYEVMLPAFVAAALVERVGSAVTLHTIQSIESGDHGSSFTPRLIGFMSPDERRFFEAFTTVKGVGTKKALRALAAPAGEVARAITLRDAGALARLPGIGRRLAETIIAQLHGKVEAYAGSLSGPAVVAFGARPVNESAARAVAALVKLGETPGEAERLVRGAQEAEPTIATADELVTAALSRR